VTIWIKKPGTTDFLGPYTREEALKQLIAGTFTADYEALEATAQSFGALKRSTDWSPLSSVFSSEEIASAAPLSLNQIASSVRSPIGGVTPDVAELLRTVISNQQRQLEALRAIRRAIVGFSLWYIFILWILPKLLLYTK